MPACQPFTRGEEQVKARPSKEQAAEQAAPTGIMLVFDVFVNAGLGGGNGRKLVPVLPRLQWPTHLRIRETMCADIAVYS